MVEKDSRGADGGAKAGAEGGAYGVGSERAWPLPNRQGAIRKHSWTLPGRNSGLLLAIATALFERGLAIAFTQLWCAPRPPPARHSSVPGRCQRATRKRPSLPTIHHPGTPLATTKAHFGSATGNRQSAIWERRWPPLARNSGMSLASAKT